MHLMHLEDYCKVRREECDKESGRRQEGWSMENPVPDGRAVACSYVQKGSGSFYY